MQVSVACMNQVSFRGLKASYQLGQLDLMSGNQFVMYYITKLHNRGQEPNFLVPGMILDPCTEVFSLHGYTLPQTDKTLRFQIQ